jgi:hypothetical protein
LLRTLAMKIIALDRLTNVTGGGTPSLGMPVYGEQGCYLQHKNIHGRLYAQKTCMGSAPGPWKRDRSVLPSYDGDSTGGAPQG